MFESIKEIAPKASIALRAMLAGLENPKIEIDMDTFGENELEEELVDIPLSSPIPKSVKVCFGCAATATLLNLLPQVQRDYWSFHVDHNTTDLEDFERVIDYLRRGRMKPFLSFYRISLEDLGIVTWSRLTYLQTDYETKDLQDYEELAELLESKGL